MVQSSKGTCPIWGTPAKGPLGGTDHGRRLTYESPRAGGLYTVSSIAVGTLQAFSNSERAKLTTWIAEQNKAGLHAEITRTFLSEALPARRYLSVAERLDNLLRFFAAHSPELGHQIYVSADEAEWGYRAHAACECQSDDEFDFLVKALTDMGLIESGTAGYGLAIKIKPQGYARLQELEQVNADSSQAFVAMWFDSSMAPTYTEGIDPGIRDTGFRPLRIDNKEHNNKIDDEIIAEIRRSRFVVCDFTSEPDKPRGGVYFEAGFAKGLGLEVIWTCRKDLIGQVHFDTRQFSHIIWETPVDLRRQLALRIRATIGQGPLSAAARP